MAFSAATCRNQAAAFKAKVAQGTPWSQTWARALNKSVDRW